MSSMQTSIPLSQLLMNTPTNKKQKQQNKFFVYSVYFSSILKHMSNTTAEDDYHIMEAIKDMND